MKAKIYYRSDTLEIYKMIFAKSLKELEAVKDKEIMERFAPKAFEVGKADYSLCAVYLLEDEDAIAVMQKGYGFRFTSEDLEWETFEPDAMKEQKEFLHENTKIQLYSQLGSLVTARDLMVEDQRETEKINAMIKEVESKIKSIYG